MKVRLDTEERILWIGLTEPELKEVTGRDDSIALLQKLGIGVLEQAAGARALIQCLRPVLGKLGEIFR